jgi:hypothetical protein
MGHRKASLAATDQEPRGLYRWVTGGWVRAKVAQSLLHSLR